MKNRKRVLLVSESVVFLDLEGKVVSRGGGESSIHKFAVVFKSLGFEVEVLGLNENGRGCDRGEIDSFFVDGIKYTRFGVNSKVSILGLLRFLWYVLKVSKKYNIVLVNQFTPQLILPFIRCKKIALVHDIYNSIGRWFVNYKFVGLIGLVVEKVALFNIRFFADHVIAVSEATKLKLGTIKNVHVIPNYIENLNKNLVENFGGEKEDYIICVARLVKYKRCMDILMALNLLKSKGQIVSAVFVFARYEKPLLAEFKKYIAENKLEAQVKVIVSALSSDELSTLINKAKVLVHTSEFEGQGLVLYEALSLGTRVVAYNLKAYDSLSENKNLVLVPEIGDIEYLANEISDVCDNYKFKNSSEQIEGIDFESIRTKVAFMIKT